jgi:hypothetical protein
MMQGKPAWGSEYISALEMHTLRIRDTQNTDMVLPDFKYGDAFVEAMKSNDMGLWRLEYMMQG